MLAIIWFSIASCELLGKTGFTLTINNESSVPVTVSAELSIFESEKTTRENWSGDIPAGKSKNVNASVNLGSTTYSYIVSYTVDGKTNTKTASGLQTTKTSIVAITQTDINNL